MWVLKNNQKDKEVNSFVVISIRFQGFVLGFCNFEGRASRWTQSVIKKPTKESKPSVSTIQATTCITYLFCYVDQSTVGLFNKLQCLVHRLVYHFMIFDSQRRLRGMRVAQVKRPG